MSSEFTRLILRQGVENERPDVQFRSGEPVYVTNYKRVFIGDDAVVGGIPVGMKFLGFCTFDPNSNNVEDVSPGYTGDIVFEESTNLLYVLSGDDFKNKNNYVSITRTPVPDNVTITGLGGRLSLIPRSLNFDYFAAFSIGRGLEKFNNLNLRLKDPGEGLEFTGDTLDIKVGGVQNKYLAPMDKDTVKARLGIGGEPSDISLRELGVSLRPFINEDGDGETSVGVPIGTIIDFGGKNPPPGYLMCDGSEYPIVDYPILAGILDTTWGIASVSTFVVPNLMGRITMGSGENYFSPTTGVETTVGSYGGAVSIELQRSQIPRHHHEFSINIPIQSTISSLSGTERERIWGATDGGPDLGTRNSIFGQPHSNIQPSAVVMKCIKAK